jgi:hypothetical protein
VGGGEAFDGAQHRQVELGVGAAVGAVAVGVEDERVGAFGEAGDVGDV